VAICTYRRPSLAAALASLRGQFPPGQPGRVLVIDNDDVPGARELVERAADALGIEVVYRHVPGRNIAIARNAALDLCPSGWLAFMDDDETATAGWLASLIEAARTDLAAVFGPVRAVYDEADPAWMRQGDFHSITVMFVGGRIKTGYTSNVLINLDHPAVTGRRFDLDLGRSGGEDTEFFDRISRAGGGFAFAPAAVVEEIVVPDRASFPWLLRRRFRSGQTHARIAAAGRSRLAVVAIAAAAAAKAALCLVAAGVSAASAVGWRRWLWRGALHLGVIARLAGMRDLILYGMAPKPRGE